MKKLEDKKIDTTKMVERPYHGSEGSHFACQEMSKKYGGKVKCCGCTGHKCQSDWKKELDEMIYKYNRGEYGNPQWADNPTQKPITMFAVDDGFQEILKDFISQFFKAEMESVFERIERKKSDYLSKGSTDEWHSGFDSAIKLICDDLKSELKNDYLGESLKKS